MINLLLKSGLLKSVELLFVKETIHFYYSKNSELPGTIYINSHFLKENMKLSPIFLARSLPTETIELVLSHTSGCVQTQEGTGGITSSLTHIRYVSSQSIWKAQEWWHHRVVKERGTKRLLQMVGWDSSVIPSQVFWCGFHPCSAWGLVTPFPLRITTRVATGEGNESLEDGQNLSNKLERSINY